MSHSKLQKGIKKYIEKYTLSKSDFFKFVKTKVQLPSNKYAQFCNILDNVIEDNFEQDKLRLLFHLIAAYQTGCDVKSMDVQQLRQYTSIKYIIKKQNQSTQKPKPLEKNQNKLFTQSQKTILINNNLQQNISMAQKQIYQSANAKLTTLEPTVKRMNQKEQKGYTNKIFIEELEEDQSKQKKIGTISQLNRTKLQNQFKQISSQQQKQITTKVEQKYINKNQMTSNVSKQNKNVKQIQSGKNCQIKFEKTNDFKNKSSSDGSVKMIKNLQIINQQKTEQVKLYQNNSSEINVKSNKRNIQFYPKLDVVEYDNIKQLVNIIKFEKMGQDFMNPIIKYQIVYKKKVTWRRYSQIQKLLTYLRFKYEGIVLPEMPPKQGIKSNLSYFWKSGVNEQFLDQRKQKLKQVLNRVLSCQYVNQDQTLQNFLTNQEFQLQNAQGSSESYFQTLYGLKDIVFNYNQLKDYGLAYYNYISEYKKKPINTQCSQLYEQLQDSMTTIFTINSYRLILNQNFQKRRQIMYDSKLKTKQPIKLNLDIILEEAQMECHELNLQYSRYLQLKSTEGWQNELIKQKTLQGGEALSKIKQNQSKTIQRINKTQQNLKISIKRLAEKNKIRLKQLGQQIIEWRKKIHP